jgi:poly-gamma-glutamate synthesis protein (capsule biosynthesis protein)
MPPPKAGLAAAALALVVSSALALAVPSAAAPRFHGSAEPLDARARARMTGVSWHRGCPVGLDRLRLLTVDHWGFDGEVHRGRLVVNGDVAEGMLGALHSLYRLHFPIRQMRLVDAYGADDHRSMGADNTSAFNCRTVAGTSDWSEHAYGRAIDLNPIENPYVTESGYVSPPAGARFADRSLRAKGLVHGGGPVVAAFADAGWKWGGNWSWPKDYQHFSTNGH